MKKMVSICTVLYRTLPFQSSKKANKLLPQYVVSIGIHMNYELWKLKMKH